MESSAKENKFYLDTGVELKNLMENMSIELMKTKPSNIVKLNYLLIIYLA